MAPYSGIMRYFKFTWTTGVIHFIKFEQSLLDQSMIQPLLNSYYVLDAVCLCSVTLLCLTL